MGQQLEMQLDKHSEALLLAWEASLDKYDDTPVFWTATDKELLDNFGISIEELN